MAAAVVEGLAAAHQGHVANPTDQGLRDAFLLQACQYFLQPERTAHILHDPETPNLATELLIIFTRKDRQEGPLAVLLEKLGSQISHCYDCLQELETGKRRFRVEYLPLHQEEVPGTLFNAIHSWNVRRQKGVLSNFLTDYKAIPTMTPVDFKRLRRKVTDVLGEIWRFPDTLQDRELDAYWTETLTLINAGKFASPLSVDDELVDAGAVIAAGHKCDAVRVWARNGLRTSGAPLDLATAEEYATVIGVIGEFMCALRPTIPGWYPIFNYSDDHAQLWRAIATVCHAFTPNSFRDLAKAEDRASFELGSQIVARLRVAQEDFWEVLELFGTLLRERPGTSVSVDTGDKQRVALKHICENEVFRKGIRSEAFVTAHPVAVNWLQPFLFASAFWDPAQYATDTPALILAAHSESWCKTAATALDDQLLPRVKQRLSHTGDPPLSTEVAYDLLASRFITENSTRTPSEIMELVTLFFQNDPGTDQFKLAQQCLARLTRISLTMLSEEPTSPDNWLALFRCIICALDVALHWGRHGDKAMAVSFIEQSLSVLELHLELLESVSSLLSPNVSDRFQKALKQVAICFQCNDAKIQGMAFGVSRAIVRVLRKMPVQIDPATVLKLRKLGNGVQRSLLSQIERDAVLGWVSESLQPPPVLVEEQKPVSSTAEVVIVEDSDDHDGESDAESVVSLTQPEEPAALPLSLGNLDGFRIKPASKDRPSKGQKSMDAFVSRGENVQSIWEKLAADVPRDSSKASGFIIGKKSAAIPKVPAVRSSKLQKLREEAAGELMKSKGAPGFIKQVVAAPNRVPQLPFQNSRDSGITIVDRDSGMKSAFAPIDKATSAKVIDQNGRPIDTTAPRRGIPIRPPGDDNRPSPIRVVASLFEQILSWDTSMEGDKPPNFPFHLKTIPNTFTSDLEYASIFEPMLVLECWEQLQKSKDEIRKEDEIEMKLSSIEMIDTFHDLTIVAPAFPIRSKGFSENDILRLTAKDAKPGISSKALLCKINNVTWKNDECSIQARVFLGCQVSMVPSLRINSVWRAVRTFSLTPAVREYTSICTLPFLALRADILNPPRDARAPPKKEDIVTMMDRFKLNEPQAAAISSALAQKTGFTLIQGPPGTGKTKTILGLISAFLSVTTAIKVPGKTKTKTNRLLCCAPSNAAIDEIVRRLKMGINDASGKKFIPEIVRIGSSEAIHSSVRDVTLESLLESAMSAVGSLPADDKQHELRAAVTTLREEREQLRARENDVDLDGQEASTINDEISVISKKINALQEQIARERQDRTTASMARDRVKRQLKLKFLMNADVILTTLSGAGSDMLGDLPELRFPTVIVDEAAQSVELSTLIPLRYGAKRCVLVGDPQQLPPTVLSQVVQGYRYEQSLFQRIMNNNPSATHLLSISYRMHPQISSYVSRAFYGGKLQDAPNMHEVCEAGWHTDPLFPPYQLVDMQGAREQTGRGHSFSNPDEARLCADLVETLCTRNPNYNFAGKIGVITFYKGQVREIKETFLRKGWSQAALQNIDVNTVDGFQGQEKEIIILSCVRSSGRVGFMNDVRRMNVAMSRAKYSLIVLGHVETLSTQKVWRHLVDDAFDRRMVIRSSDDLFRLNCERGPPPANLLPRIEEVVPKKSKRKDDGGPQSAAKQRKTTK